jgi:hypothetical protein
MPSWGAGVLLLMRIPSLKKAKTKKLTHDSGKRTTFTVRVVKPGQLRIQMGEKDKTNSTYKEEDEGTEYFD